MSTDAHAKIPRSKTVIARVSEQFKAAVRRRANARNKTVSEHLRDLLEADVAKEETKRRPP